jgi:hypothetical protein
VEWIVNNAMTQCGAKMECIINNPGWLLLILPRSLVRHLATSCVINRCAVPCYCPVHRSPSSFVAGIETKMSGS